jgi:trehalose 6-phosphate synthase/phosphatase
MDAISSQPQEGVKEEGSRLAQVTFRVRCEKIGHGEDVFLSDPAGSKVRQLRNQLFHILSSHVNMVLFVYFSLSLFLSYYVVAGQIPLFTTAKSYPWYATSSPLSLTIPIPASTEKGMINNDVVYRYRYAIYRAGVFRSWEYSSDGGDMTDPAHVHQVPMRLFQPGESYTVNDVLGVTVGPPTVYHLKKLRQPFSSINSLARKNSSNSAASLYGLSASRPPSSSAISDSGGSKSKVRFVPQPTPSHPRDSPTKQVIHLTSSDGLIVVSAFLPVHLTRSDIGEWSVDWDYEALLSMQTHLRVTRVGTVKWRGWHGNVGGGESSESGVPVDERHKVEAALRPFNCVPVWVPTKLFGEM